MASEARRLLTAHFLRRLVDDDLISPNADRHESLAMICGGLASMGLFVSVLVSMKYLFNPYQTPGATAISALFDHFLFVSASMTATALVTLLAWDGLAVDARDASVLGAMPIRTHTIVGAKFGALVRFAAMFAGALNVASCVIAPALMVSKLPIRAWQLPVLILAQAMTVAMAAAFGFFAVLALRGLLHAVLGRALFARVSAVVQSAMLVAVACAFLLLPVVVSRINRVWLEPQSRAALMAPPLWFVGLQEMAVGHIIADLPRRPMPPRIREAEARATRLYGGARTLFPDLALTAVVKLTAVTLSAILLFAWNNRRMVPPPPATATAGWIRRGIGAAARVVIRQPETQASFFFTLQTLLRSAQHRLTLAASLAFGLTASVFAIAVGSATRAPDSVPMTAGVLAVQPVLLTALLIGFRHAVRVPAELAANWAVQVAWAGDTRPHVAGAKAAGALLFIAGPVLVLLPFYALVFNLADALAIALCGLAGGAVILETIFLSYRKMPFACGYLPGDLKTMLPIALAGFIFFTYQFAHIELAALKSGTAPTFAAALAGTFLTLRAVDAFRRRTPRPFEFDEMPEPPTQRLGLS
ncbi:MAG TPA: hypothetical protein VGQ37_20130 [Vicinamibacterales bacterium]|jgi:hypothetical protein|nr:hypothetical protein [Vicinamibacterales bacterium]